MTTITFTPLDMANLRKAAEIIYTQPRKTEAAERLVRAWLKAKLGLHVESVAWIRRHRDHEFAAVVLPNYEDQYEQVLELLTTPGCPLRVAREHTGKYDTRIYIEITKEA